MPEWLWGLVPTLFLVACMTWVSDRLHKAHMALHREHLETMEGHLRLLREIVARHRGGSDAA